jgi:hypothetical protein
MQLRDLCNSVSNCGEGKETNDCDLDENIFMYISKCTYTSLRENCVNRIKTKCVRFTLCTISHLSSTTLSPQKGSRPHVEKNL